MKTLKTFADGGRVVEVMGVEVTVGKRGDVFRLSDWCRVSELEAAGHLRRVAWKGSGLYGHDEFFLNG